MTQFRSTARALTLAAIVLTVPAASAVAQGTSQEVLRSVAGGMHYQGFSFGSGSDVDAARLFLFPLAFQSRLTPKLALDGYTAYAIGQVDAASSTFQLDGPVDSWLRLRWAAKRNIVVAAGFNFPTGVEKHSPEEAVVANVLSNDLLGFREGNWGMSTSGTFGVTAIREIGRGRYTFGASYRTATGFEPRTDTSVTYNPGAEIRSRAGVSMDVKGGQLDAGFTFQSFSTDQQDKKNLFQSGNRYRADVTYSHGRWGFTVANLLRDRGELTLPVISVIDGSYIRDTTVGVGWQNLSIVSGNTAFKIGSKAIFPTVEFKYRAREEQFGRGWLTGVGASLPLAFKSYELFPSGKITTGSLVPGGDMTKSRTIMGAEFSMIIRRAQRR